MSEVDLVLLLAAALFAGFVDAVAGGGGLIQVPTLLVALPAESPATVFGTNKVASIFGTANAAIRYARRIALPWRIALPAAAAAFLFSFGGAAAGAWMPKEVVRPLGLGLLVLDACRRREFFGACGLNRPLCIKCRLYISDRGCLHLIFGSRLRLKGLIEKRCHKRNYNYRNQNRKNLPFSG